jgi:hypothetical protein
VKKWVGFPSQTTLEFFKSSNDSSPIIRLADHSFVRIEKVKNSITPMEEFSNLYRLFDGERHYFILKNDCDLMKNMKDDPIDITTQILKEGLVICSTSLLNEISIIVQKDIIPRDNIEFKYQENQFVLVFDENINDLYADWSDSLDTFEISFKVGKPKARKSHFLLRKPCEALKKVYTTKNPVKSIGTITPENSFKRAIECFNSKFVDIDYSVRCMCMYISRHYICENRALKQGRPSYLHIEPVSDIRVWKISNITTSFFGHGYPLYFLKNPIWIPKRMPDL